MNVSLKKIFPLASSLLIAGPVLAVQPYWHDSATQVVHDGFGGCVQTRDWRPELASVACGGKAEETPAAAKPTPATEAPRATSPAAASVEPISLRGDTSFALGSDALSPAAQVELDLLAARINTLESVDRIEVSGHTDNRGAAAFNQDLSERRADSVKRYLVERGVAADKIYTSGYGITRPVADNGTAEGRAANRRVEIRIHGAR